MTLEMNTFIKYDPGKLGKEWDALETQLEQVQEEKKAFNENIKAKIARLEYDIMSTRSNIRKDVKSITVEVETEYDLENYLKKYFYFKDGEKHYVVDANMKVIEKGMTEAEIQAEEQKELFPKSANEEAGDEPYEDGEDSEPS